MLPAADAPELLALLGRIHDTCRAAGARYTIIGGAALRIHGAVRGTADLDIALGLAPESIDRFIAKAKAAGFELDPEELRDRFKHQLLRLFFPLADGSRVKVDVQLAVLPHMALALEGRRRKKIGERFFWVASLEHLIVLKLIAGRARDHADVAYLLGLKELRREELDELVGRWKLGDELAEAERLRREPPG